MSVMGAGLIRPEGAVPTPPIDRNFVPLLGGLPISGVTGTGPGGHKAGSRFAVRSPDLEITEPVALVCHMDWSDCTHLGEDGSPALTAVLGLYSVLDDVYRGAFRTSKHLGDGGGTLMGRVKLAPGAYYVAGSFTGNYVVGGVDPILLTVRPVERADVTPGFYTRRTAHKLSVFDTSFGADRSSTVWAEDDAVTSVRAAGTTVYVHSDAANAAVTVHASNEVESAGVRKTASNERTYGDPDGTSVKHGEIASDIKYGTAGVTY